MIDRIHFENFRAHASLDLELGRLTVLVGPNASGKTSVLEGIQLLSRLVDEPPKQVFAGEADPGRLRTTGSSEALVLSCKGWWRSGWFEASATAAPSAQGPEFRGSVRWDEGQSDRLPFGAGFPDARSAIGATRLLRLDARSLGAPSFSDEPRPSLRSDGAGLASVLAALKLGDESSFEEIERELREIVPTVQKLRIQRTPVVREYLETIQVDDQKVVRPRTEHRVGERVLLDMRGSSGVAAEAAGEGTILVLGLLAALLGPGRPSVVLLDDLEFGLHPNAQERLIQLLRRLLSRFPDLKIVATSHSPFVVDRLEAAEVWLTALDPEGRAQVKRLSEHKDFDRFKGLLGPGEFWSSVGEDWVLAGESGT